MDKVEEKLESLGYTKEDIEEIINTYPISGIKTETLLKNITRNYNLLLDVGYSQDDIIKITKGLPSIYSITAENIKQKIESMEGLGYSKEEVLKIGKSLPGIYGYKIENIKQKIEYMESLGYSKEEVLKIGKRLPTIYSLSTDNLNRKIEHMKSLGYSKEEILKITKSQPEIYALSIENIKQKIKDIESLGYSKEEVLKMAKGLPAIYSLSIENIRQKIEYYDSIGLHDIAIIAPQNLMQSTELSYARYMFFLKEKHIAIDISNCAKLFAADKRFKRQYGIQKEELLQKYNYLENINRKKQCEDIVSLEKVTKDVSFNDAITGEEFLNKIENGRLPKEHEENR